MTLGWREGGLWVTFSRTPPPKRPLWRNFIFFQTLFPPTFWAWQPLFWLYRNIFCFCYCYCYCYWHNNKKQKKLVVPSKQKFSCSKSWFFNVGPKVSWIWRSPRHIQFKIVGHVFAYPPSKTAPMKKFYIFSTLVSTNFLSLPTFVLMIQQDLFYCYL